MAYNTSTRTNIYQNREDFELSSLDQPNIFKKGYFIKTLDPPQNNPKEPRTVTVICTYKGCK
jgi:hypothetical protein